jgi:hypothetical protein
MKSIFLGVIIHSSILIGLRWSVLGLKVLVVEEAVVEVLLGAESVVQLEEVDETLVRVVLRREVEKQAVKLAVLLGLDLKYALQVLFGAGRWNVTNPAGVGSV